MANIAYQQSIMILIDFRQIQRPRKIKKLWKSLIIILSWFRSCLPELFCKYKSVLKNFTKFTGKHLCKVFLFKKVASLKPATLLKTRLWHRCFFCEFYEISKNTFSYRTTPVAASDDWLSAWLIRFWIPSTDFR